MAGDTVQQIKDRLSIVDVVTQYVKLERAGTSLRARCPFHSEKTPSFHVSPERGTYHCFGCGAGGDIFTFVEQMEGLDFKGALKVLAEKAGVEIVYTRGGVSERDERDRLFELLETAALFYASRLDEPAKAYLRGRGISDATIARFRIGLAGEGWQDLCGYLTSKPAQGGTASRGKFSEKELLEAGVAKRNERGTLTDKFRNRIVFPLADAAGRVVGFSGRTFGEKASPDAPKYLNSPETPLFHKSRLLYGFDKAKGAMRRLGCAVLVEGQMDLIASHQAGWENTVAVSGTAFTPEHAALIRRLTDNLVIALDADQAGIKAAGKAARAALGAGINVKVARLPSGLDPADLILSEGPEAWKRAIRESRDIITFLLDVLEEHAPQQDRFRRSVESVVLPFLADVRSPIAREQYVREIAARLGVSEGAVAEALEKIPSAPDVSPPIAQEGRPQAPAPGGARARQAFSILLWQQGLRSPAVDPVAFGGALKEAAGESAFAAMEGLSEPEKESMRFAAERLYGKHTALAREADALLAAVRRDRLRGELEEASAALKQAEARGDEAEAARLMAACRVLTTHLQNCM